MSKYLMNKFIHLVNMEEKAEEKYCANPRAFVEEWEKTQKLKLTDEERELVQSMVNETFDKFKSVIREGRAFAVSKGKNSAEKPKPLNDNWEKLADGRILFAYTRYGKGWKDNSPAVIAARESLDGGRTWSKRDRILRFPRRAPLSPGGGEARRFTASPS